ncbi:MAG: orotidine-5'-phosphate decarboxylase, partial [Oscillospiraceae bacterium]
TVEYAKKRKLIVIGDIKRGDISSTAQCYAAHIDGTDIEGTHFDLWKEDFVTINPYMGYDGIKPFCEAAKKRDKGIFVLLKTSNPSSSEIQDLIYNGAPLYEHVGGLISSWGEDSIGMYGYSRVGAVVGATHREQGEALRKICPHVFFLVPGYGAQGGKAEDLKGFFDEKHRGAIVNSSRGIIAAYKKVDDAKEEDFAKYARDAALAMREDLRKAIY